MVKKLFIISILGLAYFSVNHWEQKPITHAPGILVSRAPVQSDIQASSFTFDEYLITKKARFDIQARVLSTKNYYMSREADLSPVDFALGWGVMSDQSLLDQLRISQSGRWYRWRYQGVLPVSDQQVISSSANMHMVPANPEVERALKKVRVGDVVSLKGYLIDVDHDSGWKWRTSMTRADTGGGACEIVYVESIAVR